jgi:hypothetical protein
MEERKMKRVIVNGASNSVGVFCKKLDTKLAVKVFPLVTLRTVEVVEWSVKEGVKGMKNNAIEHVRNKIIHSPRIANNAVAVA